VKERRKKKREEKKGGVLSLLLLFQANLTSPHRYPELRCPEGRRAKGKLVRVRKNNTGS